MRSPADTYIYSHPHSALLWYKRDVPKDVRARIGKSRWKQSLRTAVRADALRLARRLASEQDAAILAARRDNGAIGRANQAAAGRHEAAWLRASIAEAPPSLTPDRDYAIDPDWAMAKSAGLDAESRAIDTQLGQAAPTIEKLGVDGRTVEA